VRGWKSDLSFTVYYESFCKKHSSSPLLYLLHCFIHLVERIHPLLSILSSGVSSIPILVLNSIIDKYQELKHEAFCKFCPVISVNVIELKVCYRIGFT
jgi:hypothetical protein